MEKIWPMKKYAGAMYNINTNEEEYYQYATICETIKDFYKNKELEAKLEINNMSGFLKEPTINKSIGIEIKTTDNKLYETNINIKKIEEGKLSEKSPLADYPESRRRTILKYLIFFNNENKQVALEERNAFLEYFNRQL